MATILAFASRRLAAPELQQAKKRYLFFALFALFALADLMPFASDLAAGVG
ncbi:MAG: hypothetical protein ABI583_03550 [Betaproteobacteria bacterium]